MDVVWLKKDVRLHDHGPLSNVSRSGRPFMVLYVYEPDQLRHPCVHGSHVHFQNEGLTELDIRIGEMLGEGKSKRGGGITFMHSEITEALTKIHSRNNIKRLLAHEETGHLISYARDTRVRKWCRDREIPFVEFNQTGVTRALKDRDLFTKKYNAFMTKPQYPDVNRKSFEKYLVVGHDNSGILKPREDLGLLHPEDRPERQVGGESKALEYLRTFVETRGKAYNAGISSPNRDRSWISCSRLSPHLTMGHVSIRRVVHTIRQRQIALREKRKAKKSREKDPWLRALASFMSRMRWRAHFMQKLESEPEIEREPPCKAYKNLRASEWNEAHFEAWIEGRTGFPMVDACMRSLHRHGWLNFRMRAMVVSFACFNLWLDAYKIAKPLGRLFLDYEPGIHYPQLTMQAGITGINAMRVYSVTKQAKEHDPEGTFIRTYVPELKRVPLKYLHEPSKMPRSIQEACRVRIVSQSSTLVDRGSFDVYPAPIVDEKASAREAKERVAAVKRLAIAKGEAKLVLKKHGSRRRPHRPKKTSTTPTTKRPRVNDIKRMLSRATSGSKTPTPVLDEAAPSSPPYWICHRCTFKNMRVLAPVCEVCFSKREQGSTPCAL